MATKKKSTTPSSEVTEQDYVDLFERADKRISDLLRKMLDKIGNGESSASVKYLRKYKIQVRKILSDLKHDSAEWADVAIPMFYDSGVSAADGQLGSAGYSINMDFGRLHPRSITVLVEAMKARGEDVLSVIGRRVDDVYRAVQLDAAASSVMGYETVRKAARKLRSDLLENGVTRFVDRGGKSWHMGTYSEMAARTVTMEARMKGQFNEFAAYDEDLVQVSSHPLSCPKCEPFQGKILSISGDTPGYTTVAAAKAAGLWHPNCRHSAALWVPGISG